MIERLLKKIELKKETPSEDLIEKDLFNESTYRKIKKICYMKLYLRVLKKFMKLSYFKI